MIIDRRRFLAAAAAATAGALAACSGRGRTLAGSASPATTGGGNPGDPHTSPTAPATAAASTSTTHVGPAAFVANGPRTSRSVALTFHGSGDPTLTAALLASAERLSTPITVFAVGQWLEEHPDLASKILGGGHELANHTYTHPTLGRLTAPAVAIEITKARDVLARLAPGARWFRPSGVEGTPSPLILDQAGAAGYATVVGFDVDSLDYQDPGANAVVSRTAAGVRAGSIVSLHLGHAGTVQAYDRIVSDLRAKGLQPVTVSTLLGG